MPPIFASPRALFITCALLALGCNSAAVDDEITLSAVDPVTDITLGCPDGCAAPSAVIAIEFADSYRSQDSVVELHQYRVDYEVTGADSAIPYFASELSMILKPGGQVEMNLPLAGSKQLFTLASAVDTLPLDGIATIEFAGYDPSNEPLILSVDVPIRLVAAKREGN